jgi:hypothetical protein
MAVSSDALYSHLLEDLSPYLTKSEICDFLRKEKVTVDPWDSTDSVAAKSLASAFYKKFVDNASTSGEAAAFRKFTEMNNRCERYRLEDHFKTSWDDQLLGEFKTVLRRLLYPKTTSSFEYYEILSEARNGPGSSLCTTGVDSYSKLFSSRGSTTNDFLPKYFQYFHQHDARWTAALNLRLEQYGCPDLVEGSKLSFVPKNRDIMRSICTEPSLNMYYQLGLGSLLEKRLKLFSGIDLATQPDKNRSLAKLGSENGRFATIDLSSASDTISVSLLREVLPDDLFKILMKLRCKATFYNGKKLDLHMVSTMGNGFTFPIQTILFTCAVLAVYRNFDIPIDHPFGDHLGNYGVFGDDIIVETAMFRPLCRLLEMLGFIVNGDKSFSEGPFRESCGHDYFHGVNVRGVYVKTLLSEQNIAVLVNRLNDFTFRTGITLVRTVNHLMKFCRFQPVPLCENDDSGIKVPYVMVKKRKLDHRTQSVKYRKWIALGSHLTVDSDYHRIFNPRGEKKRIFNPEGLFLTFLQGGLRGERRFGGRIPIRLDRVRYLRRTGISPNWDYIPTGLGMRNPAQDGWSLVDSILANFNWFASPKV